jgi:hypothetical protein
MGCRTAEHGKAIFFSYRDEAVIFAKDRTGAVVIAVALTTWRNSMNMERAVFVELCGGWLWG